MTLSEKTDEEIAARVQGGDVESFGLLVERYEPKLMRYARKFLLATEDAQDVIQEVFIKSYSNIQGFDVARKFSSWIYRIAHNEFINAGKRRSRLAGFTLNFDIDLLLPYAVAEETADGMTQKRELRELLDQSLEKLTPKYREPLVLYFFEEMDYQQISEVLQIPISTVGVRLQRGKAMLRKFVQSKDSSYE
mgnify:CR=1 FL=1